MQNADHLGRPYKRRHVPVPTRYAAGEVLDRMGCLPDDLDAWVEVRIPSSKSKTPNRIYAARYLVTNHQFARFVAAGGYENPDYWGGEESAAWRWRMTEHNVDWRGKGPVTQPEYWDHPRFGKNHRGYPVVGVSWYEANAYCAWLTEESQVSGFKFQILRGGKLETLDLEPETLTVRLPTQAEWVAMPGGLGAQDRYSWDLRDGLGARDRYPWDPPKGPVTKDEESILVRANVREARLEGTSPVGMYPLGASYFFGLMDMAGNVWEWLAFEKGEYPLRGGSWNYFHGFARVREPNWFVPDGSNDNIGFRCVASAAGSEFRFPVSDF